MIRFKCNNCGKIHEYEDSELEYECIGSDPDRQMGVENEYLGTFELVCDGEKDNKACNNQIVVEFSFWEYPMLALNYSEYSEEGCIVLEEPDYQSYLHQQETDDYEE
jgi:hypothetical protein